MTMPYGWTYPASDMETTNSNDTVVVITNTPPTWIGNFYGTFSGSVSGIGSVIDGGNAAGD